MKRAAVRVSIVAFAFCCTLTVGLLVVGVGSNHYDELDRLAERFAEQPSAERLRDLLNYPADGVYSYYQGALTGVAFANHPETFRLVSENLETEQERFRIEQLRLLGVGVFEYHPELQPKDFEECFKEHAWITR